jgi:hypothetical protein
MTEDSLGNLYPYCTNDNLTRTGLPLTGKNLTLRFEGESGIYNQLWKYYMAWWTNRKQVNWVIRDPSTLSFHQKYAIDGKHYLLKKRSMTFRIDAIQPAECEFYLV